MDWMFKDFVVLLYWWVRLIDLLVGCLGLFGTCWLYGWILCWEVVGLYCLLVAVGCVLIWLFWVGF